MWKWIVAGVVAIGVTVALVWFARSPDAPPAPDKTIDVFRAVERTCIAAFNDALRRQRANEIDEVALAAIIESDVLVPWRDLRAHVAASPKPTALYKTMTAYIEARQIAWEAYATALRADSDDAARAHYDVYHQKNAEAQSHAQALGRMFREQHL